MKNENEIILLKLGGSLLTDKNTPFSLREDILESCINQIIESEKTIILVHGGGSFGHPIAKKYQIAGGFNDTIKDQLYGLAKTHEVMNKFNSIIINKFLDKKYPVVSIQPSSIFVEDFNQIVCKSIDPIEKIIELGITPVLYGDILLSRDSLSFRILSGDKIISKLCEKIQKFKISKVIFAIEEDGIYVKDNGKEKLALKLKSKELNHIKLADFDQKIDVTGSIKGKLENIREILNLKIPVQIINGIKNKNIYKALNNQHLECTNIEPSEREIISKIYNRKIEHIKIPLEHNVQHVKNYFDDINLTHHPLPEFELEDIDLSVNFFTKKISAPICIAAITGGHEISKAINNILANAAKSENIIMSVGSQRIGLEDPSTIDSFKIVREVAPNIPIIGNLGIGQLCDIEFDIDNFKKCIDMINADVMAIHFNALHELVQSEGNISYKHFEERFRELRKKLNIPLIAKEVGTGFNRELAEKLELLGFDGFDVGGTGGTSFAAIESLRDKSSYEAYTRKQGLTFREWGIPTTVSIINVREVSNKLIIATGGLRNGIDIAKSIVLGADIGGFAYKFLNTSWKDYKANSMEASIKEIKTLKHELRSSMWLMNVGSISELKGNQKKRVILGDLYQWINQ